MRESPDPADDENKRDTERLDDSGRAARRGHGLPADGDQGNRSRRRHRSRHSFPLQLNSLHELRLTLGDHSIIVKGRIVHCGISDVDQELVTYRTGIEFVEPPERVRDVITDFIDSIKSRRRPA